MTKDTSAILDLQARQVAQGMVALDVTRMTIGELRLYVLALGQAARDADRRTRDAETALARERAARTAEAQAMRAWIRQMPQTTAPELRVAATTIRRMSFPFGCPECTDRAPSACDACHAEAPWPRGGTPGEVSINTVGLRPANAGV